jgi:anti-sigma factor RsiW
MDEPTATPKLTVEDEADDQADDRTDDETDEEIVALLSDYHEGVLPAPRRAAVAAKLANDPRWRQADAELRADAPVLAALRGSTAPPQLEQKITEAIRERSAGRFFGRRTVADRLPVGALLLIAALLLGAMTLVWCRSGTGSLRAPAGTEPPQPAPTEPVAPRP